MAAAASAVGKAAWERAFDIAAWLSIPLAVGQAGLEGVGEFLPAALSAFAAAAVTSLGFLPLYAHLMDSAASRGALREAEGGAGFATALRGGAEECLFRGLLLPTLGLGPQAGLFAVAHAFDFADLGLKVARSLQCLMRGLVYGALAARFGALGVAAGVAVYDVIAYFAAGFVTRRPAGAT